MRIGYCDSFESDFLNEVKTMNLFQSDRDNQVTLQKRLTNWRVALPLLCVAAGLLTSFSNASSQTNFITEYLIDRDIIEVPFEYKNHQIIVQGQVDNREGLTFILDTGASSP